MSESVEKSKVIKNDSYEESKGDTGLNTSMSGYGWVPDHSNSDKNLAV